MKAVNAGLTRQSEKLFISIQRQGTSVWKAVFNSNDVDDKRQTVANWSRRVPPPTIECFNWLQVVIQLYKVSKWLFTSYFQLVDILCACNVQENLFMQTGRLHMGLFATYSKLLVNFFNRYSDRHEKNHMHRWSYDRDTRLQMEGESCEESVGHPAY